MVGSACFYGVFYLRLETEGIASHFGRFDLPVKSISIIKFTGVIALVDTAPRNPLFICSFYF